MAEYREGAREGRRVGLFGVHAVADDAAIACRRVASLHACLGIADGERVRG
jgi:hypothetical protein